MIEFCRLHLAPYKVPREVEIRSELPKSAIGKYLRRVLIEEEQARVDPKPSRSRAPVASGCDGSSARYFFGAGVAIGSVSLRMLRAPRLQVRRRRC